MAVGAIAVVETGGHHPGVLARMEGERRAARADVAVCQGEKGLMNALMRCVEAFDVVGPPRSGRRSRKGPLTPASLLVI
jgi:hypothetical protein